MEKLYYNWEEVEELVDLLAQQIIKSGRQIKYIFGLQRGGLIPAVLLSHKLGIPMTQNPNSPNILIVDDICDSGETFKEFFLEYPHSIFACLHFKPHTSCFKPEFSSNKFFSDAWIVYPWEKKDSKTIQDYKILL
jgi:hypoxanthine phosphoribosyltransferase